MNWYTKAAPLALALMVVSGCGGSDEDSIPLLPVSGTITMNNKPMAGATVAFLPDSTNATSTPGSDTTGPEGTYKIMYRNRSGLSAGKYKVVVTEAIAGDEKAPPEFINDPLMGQFAKAAKPNMATDDKKVAGAKNEFDAEVNETNKVFDYDVKKGGAKK